MNLVPNQAETVPKNPESAFRSKLNAIKSAAWQLQKKLIETISAKHAVKLSEEIKQKFK